jgi:hypothetical protein
MSDLHSAFDARLTANERSVRDIQGNIDGLKTEFTSRIDSLGRDFRTAIDVLANRISERSQPLYMVQIAGLGLIVSILTTVGFLALNPVRNDVDVLKAELFSQAKTISYLDGQLHPLPK